MIEEIWKPIKGFEGVYEVSSLGRVKSVAGYKPFSDGRKRFFKERFRKPVLSDGYLYVVLIRQQKQKRYLIQRLVANAFIPNPYNKPCVDHINTDKTDNRVCNLRWVTHKENQHNPITAQRICKPSRSVMRISKENEIKIYNMLKDVKIDGFNIQAVCNYCRGHRNGTYKGYYWRYVDEKVNSSCNQKKSVVRIADNNSEVIYPSLAVAAKENNCAKTLIKFCCIGIRGKYKGFMWRYL